MAFEPIGNPEKRDPGMEGLGDALHERYEVLLETKEKGLAEGFTQIPNAILRNAKITAGARLTYGVLLSYAWTKDSTFAGQKTIAEKLGFSERTVRRSIQELKDIGLLTVKRRGLGKTSLYYLRFTVRKGQVKDNKKRS